MALRNFPKCLKVVYKCFFCLTFPGPFCLLYLKTTSYLAGSINNVEVSLEESDSESTDPLEPTVSVKVILPIKMLHYIVAGFEKQVIFYFSGRYYVSFVFDIHAYPDGD